MKISRRSFLKGTTTAAAAVVGVSVADKIPAKTAITEQVVGIPDESVSIDLLEDIAEEVSAHQSAPTQEGVFGLISGQWQHIGYVQAIEVTPVFNMVKANPGKHPSKFKSVQSAARVKYDVIRDGFLPEQVDQIAINGIDIGMFRFIAESIEADKGKITAKYTIFADAINRDLADHFRLS